MLSQRSTQAAPSLSARHAVNHFPGEDALTGKARLATALLRFGASNHHPATAILRRTGAGYAAAAGGLVDVLEKAVVPSASARAHCVIVKPSRGACGRGAGLLEVARRRIVFFFV